MNHSETFQEIVEATRKLVQKQARRGKLSVSPEVAATLDRLEGQAPSTPGDAAVETPVQAAAKPAAAAPKAGSAAKAPTGTAAVAEAGPLFESASGNSPGDVADLDALETMVAACVKCPLHETRRNTVFGEGSPTADVVFVGEAPGGEEDRTGKPFVGRAGGLLTDIIVKGMKLQREDVYICNVLKCRPPMNRDPNPAEVMHCEPYLLRQLELMRPKVICCLGRVAAQTLLRTKQSTGRLRGQWHNYHGIPLRVTYHPAYLLRSPGEKRKAWEDIQQVMKVLRGEVAPGI